MDSTDTIELTKKIGVPVDLTKEKPIQDKISKYSGKNYVLLNSPDPETAYPITATDQTISYKFQTKSKLTINFIDETNDVLRTLEWTKEIGTPIDLSKDTEIINVLSDLKADNRVLEKRPMNETSYPVGVTNEPVEYRFRSNSTLIINFFDSYGEDVNPSVELTKRIGSTINIREDAEIAPVLKHLTEVKHFVMLDEPVNDQAYTVSSEDKKVEAYHFITEVNLDIQFVDEKGDIVKKLPLKRDIGSLDLTEDLDIKKAITELKGENYEVTERPLNETDYPVLFGGDPIIYKVKKTTTTVTINFVDEAGENIADVEPIKLAEIIGSTLELGVEPLKTQIQERLTKLETAHYELVESPADKQSVTETLTLVYKFKGSLFIGSFPETLNFGDKYLSTSVIKGEQPKYDKDLVIKDTRKTKGSWKLSATLEKPLTSEENPSEVINNVFFYKQDITKKVPLLKGETQPIETGTATATGEYNISEKWTNNKTGLELIVHSSKVYQTGKYTASILWQVETTP